MSLPPRKKSKDWVAWFMPQGPLKRSGPFFVSAIQVSQSRLDQKSKDGGEIVITVPRACGNAVKRNKLKRIIREELSKRAKKDLWIRLQSNFRLRSKICLSDWREAIKKASELIH